MNRRNIKRRQPLTHSWQKSRDLKYMNNFMYMSSVYRFCFSSVCSHLETKIQEIYRLHFEVFIILLLFLKLLCNFLQNFLITQHTIIKRDKLSLSAYSLLKI